MLTYAYGAAMFISIPKWSDFSTINCNVSGTSYVFQSQNGLILVYIIFYLIQAASRFQSQNGLILV